MGGLLPYVLRLTADSCPSVSTTAKSFLRHFESTEEIYDDSKQYVNALCAPYAATSASAVILWKSLSVNGVTDDTNENAIESIVGRPS